MSILNTTQRDSGRLTIQYFGLSPPALLEQKALCTCSEAREPEDLKLFFFFKLTNKTRTLRQRHLAASLLQRGPLRGRGLRCSLRLPRRSLAELRACAACGPPASQNAAVPGSCAATAAAAAAVRGREAGMEDEELDLADELEAALQLAPEVQLAIEQVKGRGAWLGGRGGVAWGQGGALVC